MNALWTVIVLVLAAGVVASVRGAGSEVWEGIAGPVVMAGASWTLTSRTWAREPAALLPMMLRAFAVKALFVVAYVVVMLKVFEARPKPFVAIFTVTFLATHFAEAYCLRRLTERGFSRR